MHTYILCCEIQNAYFTIVFTFVITIIWIHFHDFIGPGKSNYSRQRFHFVATVFYNALTFPETQHYDRVWPRKRSSSPLRLRDFKKDTYTPKSSLQISRYKKLMINRIFKWCFDGVTWLSNSRKRKVGVPGCSCLTTQEYLCSCEASTVGLQLKP